MSNRDCAVKCNNCCRGHLKQRRIQARDLPPFVNNFRGVRFSLSEVTKNQASILENAKGYLAVHVDKPEMFIGMAQMFLPDLSALAITAGDPPVRLPESLLKTPGVVGYAAMTNDAIGVAVGEGEEVGLPDFLDRDSGPDGTFLSASYDTSSFLDYSENLGKHKQQGDHGGQYGTYSQAAMEIQSAARTAFRDMTDRSYVTLRFTSDGFVADNRMTFK